MIHVRDEVGALSSSARHDLENTPTPFNVHVVFQNVPRQRMEADVRSCVSSPSMVCIGVNPKARFSSCFYGTDVAPNSAYLTIIKAGNPSFRAGEWSQGVKDILVKAESLAKVQNVAVATNPVIIQQPIQTIEHPVSAWPFLLGAGVLGIIIFVMVHIFRKQRQKTDEAINTLNSEAFEYASRNVQQMDLDKPPKSPVITKELNEPPVMNIEPVKRSLGVPVQRETVRFSHPAPMPPTLVLEDRRDDHFLTGVLVGEALSNRPVVERVIEREVSAPTHHHRERTPEPVQTSSFDDSDSGGSSPFSDDVGGGGSSGFDD